MTYGAWIGVDSKDQLQGARPDPNPSIDCHRCEEAYRYQDYWEERYVDGFQWNPAEIVWLCDECLDEMYAWYEERKAERKHRTLTEWSE